MAIIAWVVAQLLSYGLVEWLLFLVLPFLGAFLAGEAGAGIGLALVIFVVGISDINYFMASGHYDPDFIFAFGVLVRMTMVASLVFPLSLSGIWLRRRSQRWRTHRESVRRQLARH